MRLVHRMPRLTYPNGDQVDYLALTFRCEWISGVPHPADGELTEVFWRDAADLDDVDADHRRRIALALGEGPSVFEGGQ